MKIYNNCGCIINDESMTEIEFNKFKIVGWLKEEDYKKVHPEDFN